MALASSGTVEPEAVLETARLLLEPLTTGHAAGMLPALVDPAAYRYVPQEPPSLEELLPRCDELTGRRSPDGEEVCLNWALRRREQDDLIGTLHTYRRR